MLYHISFIMTNNDKKNIINDLILRKIIRNPKITNHQLAKQCNIPYRTICRYRTQLEHDGTIMYMAHVNHYYTEPSKKGSTDLVIVTFRKGIVRKHIMDASSHRSEEYERMAAKYIKESHLSERDGQLLLLLIMESRKKEDIIEIINADLHRLLEQMFGTGAIAEFTTYPITHTFRREHNYIPGHNMKDGIIDPHWPDDKIFVR